VNQYTIIWDMYYPGAGTIPFFNCQNTNNAPADGSLFLQNGDMGQGSGGYTMNNGPITAGWHRLAFAVDLSQDLITKWVDGVKAQDWVSTANALDAPRRAWQPTVLLFADGDGDDHDATVYVKSIQVSSGKLSDAYMEALGGPSGTGLPVAAPASTITQVPITFVRSGGSITLSWPVGASGWALQSAASLSSPSWQPVSGVVSNSVTVPMGSGSQFFRLVQ
jgi:hypothetical protein